MSDKEIESCWRFIRSSVDHILLCLEGLDEDDLNWRHVDNANSLYVLANHTMGNIEENILGVLCDQQLTRQREEEFEVRGNAIPPIQQKWLEVQERVSSCLAVLPPTELEREHEHPRRGKITGRDVLIVAARHAAEHTGQAQLTRDLLDANRGRALRQRQY